jgi:hypothetical protein
MANKNKSTGASVLSNMGVQLVNKIPVSIKNKNKYLLVKGSEYIKSNDYVKIGENASSADQANAILIAKGIEAINNLTDSGNGANFTLLAKPGFGDFQKIEPEDLNVYGNEIEEDKSSGYNLGSLAAPGQFEIPGTNKNDDPIYTQDPELTENQEQIFESFDNAYNENTPDPVQVIELATQVEASSGGCAVDMTNLPAGVPAAVRTNEIGGVKIEIPKL